MITIIISFLPFEIVNRLSNTLCFLIAVLDFVLEAVGIISIINFIIN